MNKILEIKNLSKNYQTIKGEIKAIDNISFALENEEVLCIVGSSGCGKSTLLNILAGLDTKTSGEIKIKDGCNIGYMLQDDALFPWLNILDNACLGLDIKKIKTKENIEFVKNLPNTTTTRVITSINQKQYLSKREVSQKFRDNIENYVILDDKRPK